MRTNRNTPLPKYSAEFEEDMLILYPRIGVLHTDAGREFYAYVNDDRSCAPFRSSDILEVVDKLQKYMAGESL